MEQMIKIVLSIIVFVGAIKAIETLIFSGKKFTCKKCNGLKTYKEMDSYHVCKNCENGQQ